MCIEICIYSVTQNLVFLMQLGTETPRICKFARWHVLVMCTAPDPAPSCFTVLVNPA